MKQLNQLETLFIHYYTKTNAFRYKTKVVVRLLGLDVGLDVTFSLLLPGRELLDVDPDKIF